MESFSPTDWLTLVLAALALVLGMAGTIISGLLAALTWLAKLFFDDASQKLAELPEIKTELSESRYRAQGDRKDIDRAHQRLDEHGQKIEKIDVRVQAVEGAIDTEAE